MTPMPAADRTEWVCAPGRIAVIGAGVIGSSWAAHFLGQGTSVVVSDPAPNAEPRVREAVESMWPAVQARATGGKTVPEDWGERLTFEVDPVAAAAQADFIQENTPENPDLKLELIALLDEAARPDVLIASSSSALLPSRLQEKCRRAPERVLVGHPFHPPHLVPLVEVVGGRRTADSAVDGAMRLYTELGKRPIRLRAEAVGHVANRLQAALWREAFSLVDKGVASVEDVDLAVSEGPGLRWALLGPFVTLGLTGGAGGMRQTLDHLGGTMENIWADFTTPRLHGGLADAVASGTEELTRRMGTIATQEHRDGLLIDLLRLKGSDNGMETEGDHDA